MRLYEVPRKSLQPTNVYAHAYKHHTNTTQTPRTHPHSSNTSTHTHTPPHTHTHTPTHPLSSCPHHTYSPPSRHTQGDKGAPGMPREPGLAGHGVGWCFTNLCYYGYSQVVVSHKIRSSQLTIHTR